MTLTPNFSIGQEDLTKQKWACPNEENKDKEGFCVSREEKREAYRLERGGKGLESTNHGYTPVIVLAVARTLEEISSRHSKQSKAEEDGHRRRPRGTLRLTSEAERDLDMTRKPPTSLIFTYKENGSLGGL